MRVGGTATHGTNLPRAQIRSTNAFRGRQPAGAQAVRSPPGPVPQVYGEDLEARQRAEQRARLDLEREHQQQTEQLRQIIGDAVAQADRDRIREAETAAAKRLQIPAAPAEPAVPSDIVPLHPGDVDYARIAALAPAPGFTRILCVRAARAGRFANFARILPGSDGQPDVACGLPLQPSDVVTIQKLGFYHGTTSGAAAKSIARTGPNLSIVAVGRRYGHGFYTSIVADKSTACNYAHIGQSGPGAVCLLTAAYVRILEASEAQVVEHTVATLGELAPPHNIVQPTKANERTWRIWFHPDAFYVEYIFDYGSQAGP